MSEDRFSLKGRCALVTGASSGIGRAVAIALAEQGATLVLHHYGDAAGARETAAVFGADTPIIEADFTSPGEALRCASEALRYGQIDILISNAAIERRLPWDEIDAGHVEAHVATNYTAHLALAGRLVPSMAKRGWGRVVATGSVLAARPRAEALVYASLKSALVTAICAVAREVAANGVTMNIVSPGAIETEATAERYRSEAFRQAVAAKIPAARHGKPEDVTGAFVFLCSDAARYITGVDIPVDGGWLIGDAPGSLPRAAA